VYEGGWIYGRTTSAGKLRDILRNRRIAFEVDEHAELFEWRSVIVHGPLYVIQVDSTHRARSIYNSAISAIRRLLPEALTESDPVPFRDQLFRIRAVEITGRASLPFGGQREVGRSLSAVTETAEPDQDTELRDRAQQAIAELGVPENSDLHVEAFDGILVLSGRVETSRDRHALETAILKVPAVIALVQELETGFPAKQEPLPADLARAAVKQLRLRPSVLGPGMKVVVEHGWLRLEGIATSQRSRDEAVRRMRAVKGARGVLDRLRFANPATAVAAGD
jgi:osmotically-inducible protein OsmY